MATEGGHLGSSGSKRVGIRLSTKRTEHGDSLHSHLEALRPKFPELIQSIREIPAKYEGVRECLSQLDIVARMLSRSEYEQACKAMDMEAMSDSEVDSYGVRHGHFSYPSYEPEYIIKMTLAAKRLRGIDQEGQLSPRKLRPAPALDTPEMGAQLWEPCEHCGREPVYLPVGVCESCWPT